MAVACDAKLRGALAELPEYAVMQDMRPRIATEDARSALAAM